MPGIADIFRAVLPGSPATAQPAAKPAVTAVGNMSQTPANPGADPLNQNLENANLDGGAPKGDSSPLDDFKDVFTIDDKKKPPVDPLSEKLFNFDQKKLMEQVGKMSFTAGLTPEVMQKIQSGDPAALTQVLNSTGQASFASAVQMLIPIMEQSIAKNNARFKTILGDEVRNVQIRQGTPDNKALQHPAAQPVLGALKTTIASQFPDLSPSQVTKKAEDYFLAMSKAITSAIPEDPKDPKSKDKGEPDYSMFLDLNN